MKIFMIPEPAFAANGAWAAQAHAWSLACNLWQAVRARLGERGQVAQGGAKAAGVVDYEIEERRVGKECRSRWSPYH